MGDYPLPPNPGEGYDQYGVFWKLPAGQMGAFPVHDEEHKVIKDITRWEEQLRVPSLDGLDWSRAKEVEAAVDRKEKMVCIMFGGGLFEMSHFLMGMEDALCNYLLYPDEMKALLTVIKDWKIAYIRQMAREVHPDIIFYHDDWGNKKSLFLSPEVWRDIIKPLQQEISDAIHESGMLYMHHADCICQPIVTDMVDLGIDIWQGAIAQNDIVAIQEITEGKLAISGGIDGPAIDIANITEEAIRAEVRRALDTYCPRGRYYPGIPNGICFREWNNAIFMDELLKYGREYALAHPI